MFSQIKNKETDPLTQFSHLGLSHDTETENLLPDDELIEEDVFTISSSGSDVDKALIESGNQLAVIQEEGATDDDPDIIPIDDYLFDDEVISLKESESNSLREDVEMALKETSVPIISITSEDDFKGKPLKTISKRQYHNSPEPLTDVEDLDHDLGVAGISLPSTLKITFDESVLTDNELLEVSDDEAEPLYSPTSDVNVDEVLDQVGTYEELIKLRSKSPQPFHRKSFVLNAPDKKGSLLNIFYNEKDGLTDLEDFDLSDEDGNVEHNNEDTHGELDFLSSMWDHEMVEISDRIKSQPNPTPSPPATPEPGQQRPDYKIDKKKGKLINKKMHASKKKRNYNFLSPRSLSPHLSDLTDTEIIYSDSEEENNFHHHSVSPKERRRRIRNSNYKSKPVDITDLNLKLSGDFRYKKRSFSNKNIDQSISDGDTENEEIAISDKDEEPLLPRNIFSTKKSKQPFGSSISAIKVQSNVKIFGQLSNLKIEDQINDMPDYNTETIESQFGKDSKDGVIKDSLKIAESIETALTDVEEIESDGEIMIKSSPVKPPRLHISREGSTEEDEYDASDNEYVSAAKELRARYWKDNNFEVKFVEINGEPRPLAVTPDLISKTGPIDNSVSGIKFLEIPDVKAYSTDTEYIESDSDEDITQIKTLLSVKTAYQEDVFTDVELFEDEIYDERFRPKSPEPIRDDDIDSGLPDATREMILIKEDDSGRPVAVVLPLGNAKPSGLIPPDIEIEPGTSEVEELSTDDDEDQTVKCPTPELPDIDGGVIQCCEIVKVHKKKSEILFDNQAEPVTDTEDIFLAGSKKRKKIKTKQKLISEVKVAKDIKHHLTDTEEIELSDHEIPVSQRNTNLNIALFETEPITDIDDMNMSGDEEEILDKHRSISVTPDCLREFSCETITTQKEGNGPFSEEVMQQFLAISNSLPMINTVAPTPESVLYTDTEDMFTSADEDGYSRAEIMTSYDGVIELEDHSSVVYMKHTRKFDIEAPEEAIHIKGSTDIRESYTDVEELGFSEEEHPHPFDNLSINDTEKQVCVCFNSGVDEEDSVCVCVGKGQGELSLVWNSKNATGSGQHEGIHSLILTTKQGFPCSSFILNKELRSEILSSTDQNSRTLHLETYLNIFQCNKYLSSKEQTIDGKSIINMYFGYNDKHEQDAILSFNHNVTSNGYITELTKIMPIVLFENISFLILNKQKCFDISDFSLKLCDKYGYSDTNKPVNVISEFIFNNKQEKKNKKKIKNRAWSGSILLNSTESEINFKLSKLKSQSVSKLISKFELLPYSSNIVKTSDIQMNSIENELNQNHKNNDKVSIVENKVINNEKQFLKRNQGIIVTNKRDQAKEDTSFKLNNTFKPIIQIIPLKDRSVSPCRLDPAPIKESPAFKALCERTHGNIESLTSPFQGFNRALKDDYYSPAHSNFDASDIKIGSGVIKTGLTPMLSEKIQKFETLSGSPKLRRKLSMKQSVEDQVLRSLPSIGSIPTLNTYQHNFFMKHTIEDHILGSLSSTSSTPVINVCQLYMTTNVLRKHSLNISSFEKDPEKKLFSIRRSSSCPINQQVKKGNFKN